MSNHSFGQIFRFTDFGESHGKAIGLIIDGVPAGVPLNEADIQPFLDKRRPGQNRFTTQRREPDTVHLLSGVFEGFTTGAPIALFIENQDVRSRDYSEIKDKFRPGHADYSYFVKYGVRDYRGGGRSSARETACRVAAGAVARKVIAFILSRERPAIPFIDIQGCVIQIGPYAVSSDKRDTAEINRNPFFAPDPEIVPVWEKYLGEIRKAGSSIGAVIELTARFVPAGLGEPLYGKLDAKIAEALMGINAVKAVEIGEGVQAAAFRGENYADPLRSVDGKVTFLSNHDGGIQGGISTGQDIKVRFAVKPTPSVLIPLPTVTTSFENTDIRTKGRHDPCVGIRAVPVGEAMLACVLIDFLLQRRALFAESPSHFPLSEK